MVKKNPSSNYRARRPTEGEVEEIARRSVAGSAYEIAINGGKIQAPEAVHWMVLVIKAGPDTLLRMLTVSDTPNPADIGEKTFALFAFVLHQRIVIDRIGA